MCLRKRFISFPRDNKWQELCYAFGNSMWGFRLLMLFAMLVLLTCAAAILYYTAGPTWLQWMEPFLRNRWVPLCMLILVCGGLLTFARILRRTFKIEEAKHLKDPNHHAQILTILAVGILIIGPLPILQIKKEELLVYGVVGTVLTWVFQDVIKGVVTYLYLHSSDMLHVGDLVKLPKYGLYGRIKDFNLINVTVENRDNTLSSVPISSLQEDSFVNMQRMVDHKTTGRCMKRSFLIDANSIKALQPDEVKEVCERMKNAGADASVVEHGEYKAVLNLQLFRKHLRFWLMQNPDVTCEPRLMVRLMDPTSEGIPLQIFTFIIEPSPEQFEDSQSRIMEHVMLAMTWFGLRQYQCQSDFSMEKGGDE